MYCEKERITKGFTKSYKNLHFYWILGAGHFVRYFTLLLLRILRPCLAIFGRGDNSSRDGNL